MSKSIRPRTAVSVLLAACALLILAAAPSGCFGASPTAHSWTADNGNGTYSNPLFYEEFEDPDVIRVGEDYYLAGTTMHMNPAADRAAFEGPGELGTRQLLHRSTGPRPRLPSRGRNIYGQGIWAPCIRYHDGMFYVFSNVNGVGTARSSAPSPPTAPGSAISSRACMIFGPVRRRWQDLRHLRRRPALPDRRTQPGPHRRSFPMPRRQMNAQGMGEGHHLYKINGKYFDVSAIPGGHTDQVVARADSIDGPWQVERMVRSESLGRPHSKQRARGGRGTPIKRSPSRPATPIPAAA